MNTPSVRRTLLAASLLLALAPAWAVGDAPAASGATQSAPAAAPAKNKPHHRKTIVRKQPAPKKRSPVKLATVAPAHQAAAPAAAQERKGESPLPAAAPAPTGSLIAFGTALLDAEDSAQTLAILPGSEAEALGLATRDRLAFLNGAAVRSRGDAAQAWLGWDPALRLWAAARRGLQVADLQSRFPEEAPTFARGPRDLSAREAALKDGLLEQAAQSAQAALAQAQPLQVSIPAKQVLWIRFPNGLPSTVAKGDILVGEVTMAVASDASLDFLCLPPRSTVWGKVMQTSSAEGTRALLIHFFKASLSGGHVIPISARLTDAAGEQPLVKVSPGGALVLGDPVSADPKKKRRGARILEPNVHLRLELTAPVAVMEPPQFYTAGAGLWIKTKDTETGRVFEVTHVIAGRSAEKMGLHVGDMLTVIGGRSTTRMEFGEALSALYGAPGSRFKVTALKPGAGKPATFEFKRGVFYKDGMETSVPLPFEKKEKAKA
jgi:hypothetical protein